MVQLYKTCTTRALTNIDRTLGSQPNNRTDAADTFRLATLLERYDKRTSAANTSAWLGTFTCGGVGCGIRGCVRRDWSIPAPRPHLEALMSLPLGLKLDVAVLLAVRATLWNSIPQQVSSLQILFLGKESLATTTHLTEAFPPFEAGGLSDRASFGR